MRACRQAPLFFVPALFMPPDRPAARIFVRYPLREPSRHRQARELE